MIRHCDGTDPNLVRLVQTDDRPQHPEFTKIACDCGLTFDDVERMVIHPHEAIPPKPTPEQIAATLAEFFAIAPPIQKIVHEPRTGLCLARMDNGAEDLRVTHVCTHFTGHPLRPNDSLIKHRCRCGFTWSAT